MTARFDIWPVLEHYGWTLPPARGVWQSIKCGAHSDSHASCRINSEAGQVKCLACDFAGDAIEVVKYYERTEYKDAVARCEELTGSSDKRVSTTTRRGSEVSDGSRYQQRRGKYTPSRLRARTDDRA